MTAGYGAPTMQTDPDDSAGRTLHRLSASPQVLSWVGEMAEAVDLPLLLVDSSGRLLNANHRGEHELGRSRLLALRDRRVRATHACDTRSFTTALAAAARSGRRRRWRRGAVLVSPLAREGAPAGEPMLLLLVLRPP